jgi:fructose/tagatose bisphosphate aldolase
VDQFDGLKGLRDRLKASLAIESGKPLRLLDPRALQGSVIDDLVYNAVFNPDAQVVLAARALVAHCAHAAGANSASIHELYAARGRSEVKGFTVPAVNIRGITYHTARAMFRVALKLDCTAMIFELARSEIGYTFQRPPEYATCVLAAAVREGFRGPVFIQGDHYQVNAKKFKDQASREPELRAIRELCAEAISGGVFNIDIDSSTLVDLDRETLAEQQRDNYELCAAYTRFIREHEPKGTVVSVGGEIGEVGTKNSNVDELRAFMKGYRGALGAALTGISKISVQTGTSHGGIPLPGGGVAEVQLDFGTLRELSKVAREEYGLAGAVQHGASTLPKELFHHFPETETAEVHLATEFQNMVFDHPAFPEALRQKMNQWCAENCADERKAGQTEKQFIYKTRKKAWGPFKRELWTLKEVDTLLAPVEERLEFLWRKLNVASSRAMVDKYVKPTDFLPPLPEGFTVP